jgi:hypothetical protein
MGGATMKFIGMIALCFIVIFAAILIPPPPDMLFDR